MIISDVYEKPRILPRFAKAYFWVGVAVALIGAVGIVYLEQEREATEFLVFAYKMGYCGGCSMFLASPLHFIVTLRFRIHDVIGFVLGSIIAFLLTEPTLDLIERLNWETFWLLFIPPIIALFFARDRKDKFAQGIRSRY